MLYSCYLLSWWVLTFEPKINMFIKYTNMIIFRKMLSNLEFVQSA